jgi:hypothetical protein
MKGAIRRSTLAMLRNGTPVSCLQLALVVVAALLCACSAKHFVVGEQCPSPLSGDAAIAGGDAGGNVLFGTSCARKTGSPCGGVTRLDKRGCPIFVTFDTCGGDICLGDQLIPRPDAGSTGEDAGAELDAGEATSAP